LGDEGGKEKVSRMAVGEVTGTTSTGEAPYSALPELVRSRPPRPGNNPFYNPQFLFELNRLRAGTARLEPIRVLWKWDLPLFETRQPSGALPPVANSVYIVDEHNRIVHAELTQEDPDTLVERWYAEHKSQYPRPELFQAPMSFKGYSDGAIADGDTLIYKLPRTGSPLESLPTQLNWSNVRATLHESYPHSRQRLDIELAYLESVFHTRQHEGEPAPDFSDQAMLQAFHRLHPSSENISNSLVKDTPIVQSRLLALYTGASEVWVKDESEQWTGSFKPRGALNKLKAYLEEVSSNGRLRASSYSDIRTFAKNTAVIAASHGNHANGVIWAANQLDFGTTLIVLPLHEQTQKVKIRQCLEQGALVILYGNNLHVAMGLAEGIAQDRERLTRLQNVVYLPGNSTDEVINQHIRAGQTVVMYGKPSEKNLTASSVQQKISDFPDQSVFVPTYDDPYVSMGQATDSMQLVGHKPHLLDSAFNYIVPAGGLGKLAGDLTFLRRVNPNVRVVGVNRYDVPAFQRSLNMGRLNIRKSEIEAAEVDTAADGVDVPRIGTVPFEQIQKVGGARAVLVSEDEIEEALVFAATSDWYNGKSKVIEGASAATLAATLNGAAGDLKGAPLVLSVTGKNIDLSRIERLKVEKNWMIEKPERYRVATLFRTYLRKTKGRSEKIFIEEFNRHLKDPTLQPAMVALIDRNDFPTDDAKAAEMEKVITTSLTQRREASILTQAEELLEARASSRPSIFHVREFARYGITRLQDSLSNILGDNTDLLEKVATFTNAYAEANSSADVVAAFTQQFPQTDKRLPWYFNLGIRVARQSWIPDSLKAWPLSQGVSLMAKRYIAGDSYEAAKTTFDRLNSKGMGVIADVIGEEIKTQEEANVYRDTYLDLVQNMTIQAKDTIPSFKVFGDPRIQWKDKHQIVGQVALKFSSLTPLWNQWSTNPAAVEEAVKNQMRPILEKILEAASAGVKIGLTIDLEQFEYRGITYRIFKDLFNEEKYRGMENVGIVVQNYYKDSLSILKDLETWSKGRAETGGAESIFIRLVKGAYHHYETEKAKAESRESPVFDKKEDTDANYERAIDYMVDHAMHLRMGVASHNFRTHLYARQRALEAGVPMEGQMLLGIEDTTKEMMAKKLGIPMFVYTPIGAAKSGIAYLVRRLRETAADVSFVRQLNSAIQQIGELFKKPALSTQSRSAASGIVAGIWMSLLGQGVHQSALDLSQLSAPTADTATADEVHASHQHHASAPHRMNHLAASRSAAPVRNVARMI